MEINTLLNHIHEWGEPEQHPMKRMALTRITCVGVVGLEALACVEATWDVGAHLCGNLKILTARGLCTLFPDSTLLKSHAQQTYAYQAIGNSLLQICKLIVGLASTILIGIVFSPEINFRIHLKIGLAVDNLALRKQKYLAAKMAAEAKAAELAQIRAARFAQFQAEQQAAKDRNRPNSIDARLAELL